VNERLGAECAASLIKTIFSNDVARRFSLAYAKLAEGLHRNLQHGRNLNNRAAEIRLIPFSIFCTCWKLMSHQVC
jgi:hypothetical protein